jgi:imidazolonepropionase-like amidohydrolase
MLSRKSFILFLTTLLQRQSGSQGCLFHGDPSPPNWPEVPERDVSNIHPNSTAIVNVRVFDGYRLQEPRTIYLDQGRIVPYIEGAQIVVDGCGGVLLPGLIDSHLHPYSLQHLEDLSSYGVTTAMGMSCFNYTVCHALRNQPGLTALFTAGFPAQGPNSSHAINLGTPPNELIYSSSQADQFVANVFGNGSDYLKITAEQNGPDQATQNALVAAAHARGQQVMTHAANLIYYQQAIYSKTNGIQHSPADKNLTQDLIQMMLKQRQHVTPTMEIARLVLVDGALSPAAVQSLGVGPSASYYTWRANVRAMHLAGVPILAGTDASDTFNTSTFGWTLHEELYNLVDAGLTNVEALRAATLLPSLLHDLPGRGRIEDGMRADLVLLAPGANPLENIRDTRKIVKVWNGGIEYPTIAPWNSTTIPHQ